MAWLLYQMVFRRERRQPKLVVQNATTVSWPGLDSEFYRLERKLIQCGWLRQPGETLSDWLAQTLADPALVDLRKPLTALLQLHYNHRFDPRGLDREEREALAREAKICVETLSLMDRSSMKTKC
jgi:hypothetical protein